MAEAGWLQAPALAQLVRELSSSVAARYQVDPETAARLVADALARQRGLERLAGRELDAAGLRRTREYRAAASAARRHVYYQLRRYDRGPAEQLATGELDRWPELAAGERERLLHRLATGHVSCLERLEGLEGLAEFHRQLFALVGSPSSVLDVGCGRYPLLFPFDGAGGCVRRYAAVDRDAATVELVGRYARARGDGRLTAVHADLADGWPAVTSVAGLDRFDLALLLKVLPVMQRLRPRQLGALRAVPAELVVLTGAVQSMTRRQWIERRERQTLRRFADRAGWRVLGELRTADEVGLVCRTRGAG